MNFKQLCEALENEVIASYTEGVTLDQAEKLAGRFLHAQMKVSNELKTADLDARTRKSGVKAVRAAIYLDIVQSSEKKPTEGALEHMINTNGVVSNEQSAFDSAEVEKANLERYYDIFASAHVYFRQMARGVQG